MRIKKANGHSHHYGHSHSHGADFNSNALMLHLLEDVLGWVAVLIGAVVIYFTGWYWIDRVLTIAISIFIGCNAAKNLINTMAILMQSLPENVDVKQLSNDML